MGHVKREQEFLDSLPEEACPRCGMNAHSATRLCDDCEMDLQSGAGV